MARFAKIGVGAGKTFDAGCALARDAEGAGGRHGRRLGRVQGLQGNARSTPARESSADGFGTRAFLKDDYIARMSGAVLGIYGNSKEEAHLSGLFRRRDKPAARRREPLHAALRAGPAAAGQRLLVAHDVRAAGEPALRQSAQPLPDQFADAAEPEARRRRRHHALRAERIAGRRTRNPTGCRRRRARSSRSCGSTGRSPRRWTASGRRRRCSG